MDDTAAPFDRRLVRRHRDRAASRFASHDVLFRETAERLADRLDDLKRRFPLALDIGARSGILRATLTGRGGIETLVETELSPALARMAAAAGGPVTVADTEALPFGEASVDLVLSNLDLHWVNDLPGALIQLRRALKPDGLMLAAMLGGDTLIELRQALAEAEIAVTGGISPRTSPLAGMADAGGLLQRAGFALPVVDSDRLTLTYPDPFALMAELRGMGEANATVARLRVPTRRAVLMEAAARYTAAHGDADGRVPATFHIIYLSGWAPHESQQKPLRPGTAAARIADALHTDEIPTGVKPGDDG